MRREQTELKRGFGFVSGADGGSVEDEFSVLTECWQRIGPRAKRVLVMVAERLAIGAERYNDDLSPGRDWRNEGVEELLDCIVYFARARQDGAQ